jgi:hypothetical protein
MFGLGRPPKPGGPLFQGLDETVIATAYNELSHLKHPDAINN